MEFREKSLQEAVDQFLKQFQQRKEKVVGDVG